MKKNILLMLMAAILVISCGNKKEDSTKAPTRVNTEVVTGKTSSEGQSYVGIVEEREATAVSFTGMGVIKRMLVNEGQRVGKGQVIAEMDDTQASNMLSASEAQMMQADDALKRYQILHENGSLPEVQWIEIQSKVAQAKAQLEVAKKNLADCKLTAPVSGVIGKKMVGAGETALPSQAVVNILDISSVKVRVSIPEAEIGNISSNTPTMINVDAIKGSYAGGRIEKGVQADALTHTYDILIHVDNKEQKLLPGMVANVKINGATSTSMNEAGQQFTLPITAVQKRSDGSLFVWAIDQENKAHRLTVTIGETLGNRVSVTSGIQEQQRVVTEGYQKLSEGTKVVY